MQQRIVISQSRFCKSGADGAVPQERSRSFVADWRNGTGAGRTWGYLGAFLIAGIASAYIFYGFDTAGSLAEETNNPRKHAPSAILRAMAAAALLGGLLILFAFMSMPNILAPKTITAINNGGLPYIVKTVLGTHLGDVFLVCSAIAITVCALAVHTAGIRIMFTMARDGRLPFSRHIARVSSRSKTPIIPALFIGVLGLILLLINIGNQRVFLVLTSVAIIMFYIPYMCVTTPLLLKRLRGDWPRPEHGPFFSMGRFGLPLNIIAVLYQTAVVVNLAWPRPDVYGSDHWYFQWGAFVFVGGVAVLGGIYYVIRHHGRISEVLSEHRAPAAPSQPMGEPPLTAQA